MSSNIYEEPNKMMNVIYSKGATEDRGEREERQVDIYNSGDTDHHLISMQGGGAHTQNPLPAVHTNPFRAAALILGLLCLLLVVGVIALSSLYITSKSNQPDKQTLKTGDDKAGDYCSQEKDNQNITRWVRFRCSCYYISTEVKMWEESRKACQSRGADLVIINNKEEQDFVSSLNRTGDSWIGLQSVKEGWSNQWQWVDHSTLEYRVWREGVKVPPTHNATVYIDVQGLWNHTHHGSKQWICEKKLN